MLIYEVDTNLQEEVLENKPRNGALLHTVTGASLHSWYGLVQGKRMGLGTVLSVIHGLKG